MSNSSNENLILEEKYPPRSLTEVANIDLSFIKEIYQKLDWEAQHVYWFP